ncbi:hypothetical protein KUTeg_005281 [Tegillarca granosa]|uniref:Uncharacterized protein n=1 Tax=Tegillarca granosa TaxID=220873 RepID=A0ABQ9FJ96_TEGGR|nr:hypothetical protein KUTeg_005281 [Tegillarca granosa]
MANFGGCYPPPAEYVGFDVAQCKHLVSVLSNSDGYPTMTSLIHEIEINILHYIRQVRTLLNILLNDHQQYKNTDLTSFVYLYPGWSKSLRQIHTQLTKHAMLVINFGLAHPSLREIVMDMEIFPLIDEYKKLIIEYKKSSNRIINHGLVLDIYSVKMVSDKPVSHCLESIGCTMGAANSNRKDSYDSGEEGSVFDINSLVLEMMQYHNLSS